MDQKFEHQALERDIQELSREIKERNFSESAREAIHKVVKEKIEASAAQSSQPSSNQHTPQQSVSPLPNYADNFPAETKLQAEILIDMAIHQGLAKALQKAKGADPITIDIFHDAITDKLYKAFKARGLIDN